MKEKVNIGVIGLGCRGSTLLKDTLLPREEVVVRAVCDLYEDRREEAGKKVHEAKGNTPLVTADYHEILAMEDIDCVLITASWDYHVNTACDAMKAGKAVALEVGGAYSIEDCWKLVRTYEETGTTFMLMENCCFGRNELMTLNMVKQGIFGEIIHCSGGYHHDLRDEISFGRENRHYRLRNYLNRNCENYPTHELGPIAKVLDINAGNRMISLTSMASKAAGIHDFLLREKGSDYDLSSADFRQGDMVTTCIKCARGQTIVLTLDTTLPRYYSRGFTVRGTRGMFHEDTRSIFLDNKKDSEYDFKWNEKWNNVEEYREQYEHPIWQKYLSEGVQGGHDGMDWLEMSTFIECVRTGKKPPIDVYDAASWMCITALSEDSIAMGSLPVAIPDFTNGMWLQREPVDLQV